MKKNVFFGQNDLRFYYFRYKDSNFYSWTLLLLTFIVSLVLIFSVIIPLIKSNFSIRQEVTALNAKIATLNENINFMNNLDKSVLNSQLQTAMQALPADKDYLSILNALSDAAIISGVTLNDFNFSTSKIEAAESKPSVVLIIIVNGDIEKVKEFLKQINLRLPLAKIINVDNSLNSTTIGLEFFYKELSEIAYKENERITPLSDKEIELIRKLSSWRNSSSFEDPELLNASTSGSVPLF